MKLLLEYLPLTAAVVLTGIAILSDSAIAEDFGLDCSWPIHSNSLNCGDLLGDRQAVYDEYMEGCRQKWGPNGAKRGDANEEDRIEMSRRQPQSMVNYTSTGFKHIKAPPKVWNLLSDYWNKNKDDKKPEEWGMGNVYTNNWA
ncbi:MAG: hypothetical protein SGARI_007398, partial [Bacillariaceae sp.]